MNPQAGGESGAIPARASGDLPILRTAAAERGREVPTMFSHLSISDVRSAMSFIQAAAIPTGEEWVYEFSWAGERVLAAKEGASVHVKSVAHRRDLTNRFPAVAAAIAKLNLHTVVLDGIVRTLDARQLPLFGSAIEAVEAGAALIRFIAVDLLWADKEDVRRLPLGVRKERLTQLTKGMNILVSHTIGGAPDTLRQEAERVGAEGILAKRRDSRYRPYGRNGDWVRVPLVPPGGERAEGSGEGEDSPPNRFGLRRPGPSNLRFGPAFM